MDEQRQRFEAWVDSRSNEFNFNKLPNGEYESLTLQCCWESWLAAQPQWQDISTAPKDGTVIYGYEPKGSWKGPRGQRHCATVMYWHQPGNPDIPGYWDALGYPTKYRPTLWQPLPPPPSKRDGEAEGGK